MNERFLSGSKIRRDIYRETLSTTEREKENKIKQPISYFSPHKSYTKSTGATTIKKIYTYLNYGTTGLKDFEVSLRSKYPDHFIKMDNREKWTFTEEEILEIFNNVDKFKLVLDDEGLDTFDKLYYWAVKNGEHLGGMTL